MANRRALGDASILSAAIETQHPDPFRAVSRDTLLREVTRVDAVAANDRTVLTVELMRMLALLGPRNGHTAIHPLDEHPIPGYAFPLGLFEFSDGVFVVAADRDELVGTELVAVEGTDIAGVLTAVTPLIAHDNEWTIRARRPMFVVDAAVLHGLGVITDKGRAVFRLRRPTGSTADVALEVLPARDYRARIGSGGLPKRPEPTYLCRRDDSRWAELGADGRVLHVGYNVTRGDMAEFARDVAALAASPELTGVVLDLRHNGGGDNRTYAPLLETLERLGHDHAIRVLTSRATFSAAMQLVVDLEQRTPAVFVGEHTGGSPNQYGDATLIQLPNSGLNAHVATIAWMTAGETDERLTREPDIPVGQHSSAFFAGTDPTLDAAVAAL